MAEAYVRACHRGDLAEVKRLYSEKPHECSCVVFDAFSWCTPDIHDFVLSKVYYPSAVRVAFDATNRAFRGKPKELAAYAAEMQVLPDRLCLVAARTDNADMVASLLTSAEDAVSSAMSAMEFEAYDVLRMLCARPEIAHKPRLLFLYAITTKREAAVIVCNALAQWGAGRETFQLQTPCTLPWDMFIYLDVFWDSFSGNYDGWLERNFDDFGIVNYLIRSKNVKLVGHAWNVVQTRHVDLALVAVERGLGDWRACDVISTFYKRIQQRMTQIRMDGFSVSVFLSLPKELRDILRTILLSVQRAQFPPALFVPLFNATIVAYTHY